MSPEWFAAVSGERAHLFDSLGQVAARVYLQELHESRAQAIASAMALAHETGWPVCVYDVHETFLGTAHA